MSAGGFIHFGKYELLSRINIGGMAEIVKACDTSAAARPLVAVKRILPHLCDDTQYRTMFLDESRVLAQLDHPNIIHSFEIGEVEGTPYIAMDFVDGQDARTLFHKTREAEQRIPIPVACYIIASVCDGLSHAHEKKDSSGKLLGLVHRDVSLQNILLSYAGDVKITDFGIAVSSQNEARTEVGIVKGKFGYMSPEQIRGTPLDRRSDIFGAGICLYELLTGERLFWGDNDYKAIEKVRNVSIDPPSKLNRNIPSELERIVMKALAKLPKDRHQTALELRNELKAFMESANERCTRDDLGTYLRTVFASEYDSEDDGATTIGSNPELDAARAALAKSKDLSTPVGVALDGTTGLGAFDHLDPVSTVSFAIEPDVPAESFAQRSSAKSLPSLRSAQATLPPPGMQPKSAPIPVPSQKQTLRPAAPPQVPPVVPRPDSVPGTHTASELLGDEIAELKKALPEPQPMEMDWDEAEPTTVSKGLPPIMAMPAAAADSFDPDEAPTNVRLAEAMPAAVASAFDSDPYTPSEPQKPFELHDTPSWRGKTTMRLARVAGARGIRFDSKLQIRLAGAVVAALVLLAASLYWSRSRGPATIRLATDPRDAVVTVDGNRVPSTASPFVLSGLDPSVPHTIAVEKNGYLGWASRLSLGANQVLDLPLIKLDVEVVQPTAAAPPAALIPATAEPTPTGETPAANAEPESERGYKPKERAAAQSGSRTSSRASRPAPSEPREKRAAKPATTKSVAEPAPPKRAAVNSAPAAASTGGMGMLRVNSRPWSRVIVDGHLIGNTPQMAIPLKPGKHSLNLVNPEFGIDKTVYVEIKAGETVTRVITLQ